MSDVNIGDWVRYLKDNHGAGYPPFQIKDRRDLKMVMLNRSRYEVVTKQMKPEIQPITDAHLDTLEQDTQKYIDEEGKDCPGFTGEDVMALILKVRQLQAIVNRRANVETLANSLTDLLNTTGYAAQVEAKRDLYRAQLESAPPPDAELFGLAPADKGYAKWWLDTQQLLKNNSTKKE